MAIFEKPPVESLVPVKGRWTPLYLEHGRLSVDDSSVKWSGRGQTMYRIPVATVSALLIGPGTIVTHAAIKACSESNTPVCWVGEEGLHFYAVGVNPTHDNSRARLHSILHSSVVRREEVARKLFSKRFPGIDVSSKDVEELRGMEGYRIRQLYVDKGRKYGVEWRGRRYDKHRWSESDPINRAISCANSSLYALCTSAVCSLGYLPQLGFIHTAGTISFVLDVADIFKGDTSLEAAFEAVSKYEDPSADQVLTRLKTQVEATQLMRKIPLVLEEIMQ